MGLIRGVCCSHRVLLGLSNFTLLGCSSFLLVAGSVLFLDSNQVLISVLLTETTTENLPKPLFYYLATGLFGAGLAGLFASLIGCWALADTNYCTLTLYFLIGLAILIAELVISISVLIWPYCLGLRLEEDDLVRALQGNYGVPGSEQFTAAIDNLQTRFQCCGISSDINYDTSLWRLQSFGHKDLVVPLTCCFLEPAAVPHEMQYLDPKPTNLTVCQSLQRLENIAGRHSRSCFQPMTAWLHQQYLWFIGIASTVAIVNFFVLVSVILSCTKMKRQQKQSINKHMAEFERKVNNRRNIIPSPSSLSSSLSEDPQRHSSGGNVHQQYDRRPRENNYSFQPGPDAYLV